MTTAAQLDNGIEVGNQEAILSEPDETRSRLVLASFNIRYGVGRYLISSGLGRKIGINLPRPRAETVGRNIKTAARAFAEGSLLPRPDILALQEADKQTARAGGRHVAAELARELNLPYVHVAAGIPRGIQPKRREWWLNRP